MGCHCFARMLKLTWSWNEVVSIEVVNVKENQTNTNLNYHQSKPPPDGFGPWFFSLQGIQSSFEQC